MKRVGGRTGQLVRSASRRNKTSSRFQFDVTIDNVQGLKPGAIYFVKWARGVKVAATKPFTVPKDAQTSYAVNQKITLMVTLYREDGKKFDPKEAKLSIISTNQAKKERTIAKTKFDLATYAGVPSSSTVKTFKMADKIFMSATVESRFLKAGASGPGSAGASSAMSGLDGASLRSSDEGGDDLDDLALDDVPEPEVIPPVSTRSAKAVTTSGNSSFGSKASSSVAKTSSVPKTPSVVKTPSLTKTPSFPKTTPNTTAAPTPSNAQSSPSTSFSAPSTTPTPSSERRAALSSPTTASAAASAITSNPPKRATSPGLPAQAQSHTRERAAPVAKEGMKSLPRVSGSSGSGSDDVAAIASLRQQSTRLSAELEQTRRQREALAADHKLEIDNLTQRLDEKTRTAVETTAKYDAASKSLSDIRERNVELSRSVEELDNELGSLRKERDEFRKQSERLAGADSKYTELAKEREELLARCKRLDSAEAKSADLSKEVDRLTLASARSVDPSGSQQLEEVERRMATLQKEKETLEKKVKSHDIHVSKVKGAYQQLSDMYETLREDHKTLQLDHAAERTACREAKLAAAAKASSARSDNEQQEDLMYQLEEAQQKLMDEKEDKESLQTNYDDLARQVDTLKDRLNITTQALSESQRELDDLYNEVEQLKDQRDRAVKRALSKGKSNSGGDSGSTRSLRAAEEELNSIKEKSERDAADLQRRIDELETELTDVRDDLEYEKTEKAKARDDRDKMREATRTLERRTSQAARATDAMHSLRRELSTHQMRTQDHESMIEHMKNEMESLRQELDDERSRSKKSMSSNADEVGEVLNDLVVTKLALAEAKSEKQQLEFAMKQLGRDEKALRQQLSAHASQLEVRLEQATEELDRLRKQRKVEDRSEFNELGSDVDY